MLNRYPMVVVAIIVTLFVANDCHAARRHRMRSSRHRPCPCQSTFKKQAVIDNSAQTDGWQPLFDGESLDDWTANENKDSFKVVDGAIVAGGNRSHLFYDGPIGDHDFKNFQLKLKVKTEPNSNSGVYFHTRFQDEGWPEQGFEAQVNSSPNDHRKTGSLYGVVDVTDDIAKDGEWFDYEIKVEGKHVTITVNGEQVADFTETDGDMPHLKEFPGRKIGSGTIALQAHDPGSVVHYKDIRIKPLP